MKFNWKVFLGIILLIIPQETAICGGLTPTASLFDAVLWGSVWLAGLLLTINSQLP